MAHVPSECQVVSTWSVSGAEMRYSREVQVKKVQTRNPIIDSLVVIFGVLDILVDFAGVEWLRRAVPSTHVNTNSQRVREELFGGLDVDVPSRCW